MNIDSLRLAITNWGLHNVKKLPVFIDLPSADEEYEANNFFTNISWENVTEAHLEKYWLAPTFFTPQGLKYFLPSIILISIKSNNLDLFYDSLLSPLDSGNGARSLPELTLAKWQILSKEEISIVIDWLFWLLENKWFGYFEDDSMERVINTLSEISECCPVT